MEKLGNKIFFGLILMIFACGVFTLVKPEQLTSESEYRSLTTFSHPTVDTFVDSSFQDNLESALSDQFILSEEIRTDYRQAIASTPTFGLENAVCQNRYLEIINGDSKPRATFNCEDYIVYYPKPLTDEQLEMVYENIDRYNRANKKVEAYYYLVNESSVFDFRSNEKVKDYNEILSNSLHKEAGLKSFDFDNFETYKKYFYKTDHHWNYVGSYKGYSEIVKMLGINEVAQPIDLYTNHEAAFGSHARITKNFSYPEEFAYYRFKIPRHDTTINGINEAYNHFVDYENHNYEYNKKTNYYAYVYGDDFGEIIFDFHQPEKENLLIISDSYSNPIDELIAQHFNQTFVVDLRYYSDAFGHDFRLEDYIKQNQIAKALIILSPNTLEDINKTRGLEE